MSGLSILVVDDEPAIRNLVQEILEDEGYEVATAGGVAETRSLMRERRPDLILLDIWMPDGDGITLLKEWQEAGGLPCPVIMMSGHGTVETAVEATRLGAYDFLEKPLSMAKLILTTKRALEADELARENIGLRRQAVRVVYPEGSGRAMQALREQAKRIARHDTWVLISGESGVGKQTFARYLHSLSQRRDQPFVEVAVASLAGDDSALELFGREQGERIRHGLLEQASGGVLFLDEVADMDMQAQGRLFSALENRSVTRIGGTERVPIDVRVFAATQHDLGAEVRAGNFREDLYYRLAVVPITIPPLRDRPEDVPELLAYYVDLLNAQEGLPYRRFTTAAVNRLRQHAWPGNVRELRNLVQRLLILGNDVDIGVDEVEAALAGRSSREPEDVHDSVLMDMPLREAREQFERQYLLHQLERVDGSMTRLSERVGLERTHLYRKLKMLGIDPRRIRAESGG
ncbi:MAG: sigma-54 dependent transcriptional regulator [Chromatiales bacterium]|nr:sigma-54 dependent transcriptional regulator [Chromatiales bacterium]MDX9767900.1 sigma-54 dependent transcriptional regulator [Ectothiorhodospiraceae bacterium]